MEIIISGDFCPQKRVSHLFDNGDFNKVIGGVKPVLEHCDYAIVNFECPVCYGEEEPISKCGPNLRCSERGVEAVKWAGFDCVTLANNHFYDYGNEGVQNTLKVCLKHSLDTVGGGLNFQEASKVLYKTINGQVLAIINCCEHEFSIATEKKAGSNPLNPIYQYNKILEARENADLVLVIVHGGHEHFQLPSPRMQELYRFFIDIGADAVVNHHQHCYSGYELYKNKPIFYGLGNFCFDGNRSGKQMWYEGYMVRLKMSKQISFDIIPYIQCKDAPCITLLDASVYDKNLRYLNNIISNPKELEKAITRYYDACATTYSEVFEPCNNRLYIALKRRGWLPSFLSKSRKLRIQNYIDCEAHRDKLLYYLHNN